MVEMIRMDILWIIVDLPSGRTLRLVALDWLNCRFQRGG